MNSIISQKDFIRQLANPILTEAISVLSGCNYVMVDASIKSDAYAWPDPTLLPTCPVIAIGGYNDFCDVCVEETQLDELVLAIDQHPIAATALVQVLRHNVSASVHDGLLAESLTYSNLQQSSEFQSWLQQRHADHPPQELDDDHEPVLGIERDAERYTITLNRPKKHNAYSQALKDQLCSALHVPCVDDSITEITIRGNGKSFCAGGDLDEFGSVTDAQLAHLSRTTRSAAPLIHQIRDKIRVELHGACIGAGIELPAFAGAISAREDAFFQLPEVAMGLIPGAGGTVSICKRIGKSRTTYMALTNKRIDAQAGIEWGLIDELTPG